MNPSSDRTNAQSLRGVLLAVCIVAYFIGMWILIVLAKDSVLRPLIDVRYALFAYCGIVAACIISMVVFARRVPVATMTPGDSP